METLSAPKGEATELQKLEILSFISSPSEAPNAQAENAMSRHIPSRLIESVGGDTPLKNTSGFREARFALALCDGVVLGPYAKGSIGRVRRVYVYASSHQSTVSTA